MPGMDGFINFNGTLEGSIAGGDSGAVKDVKTNASGSYQSVVDEAGNAMIDLSAYAKETEVSEDIQSLSGQLSNKQNIINYSTEEQDTGIKWIDGKPIYQKTFDITITSPRHYINITSLEIDKFVDSRGVIYSTSADNTVVIPLYETQNFYCNIEYDNASRRILLYCTNNVVDLYSHATFTIWYTKTTDTLKYTKEA